MWRQEVRADMVSPSEAPGHSIMLPVVNQRERKDVARNRRTLLSAAQKIMVECGVEGLSMDRVAAQAGVGVGTVYRHFGDRGGLAFALLDYSEQQFQAAFLTGPPPLGPDAPAAERIRAFLHAYAERLDTEADLHAIAEMRAPTARHDSGAYRTARAHLAALLPETGVKGDVTYVAEALLALVGAGLFIHQRRELHFSMQRIKAGLDQVLAELTSGRVR